MTNETNVPAPGQFGLLVRSRASLSFGTPSRWEAVCSCPGGAWRTRPIAAGGQRRPAIRVGIVDDHPVFRLGLKRALERETDIDVAWEMGSASTLDTVMKRTPVDVILMDLFMGAGNDGIAATRAVMEKWPEVKVAVISASLDERNALASARAGAQAFLPKAMPVSEMVGSIRRLAAQQSARGGSKVKGIRRTNRATGRIGGLSPRERQVLEELRLGRTNREIAARMGISIGTVNKHVHEVLTVLKVRNRTQAAAALGHERSDG